MAERKILVIDDQRGIRESLRMILETEHRVLQAEGPLEGLALVKSERPDLVFCDIRMPTMSGIEVLRQIKEFDPDIEVAMITAYGALDTAQEALRYGAIDYLLKPFRLNEVLAVTEHALKRVESREATETRQTQLEQTTGGLAERLREVAPEAEEGAPQVLVVLHDEAVREGVVAFLQSEGLRVAESPRGRQALSMLAGWQEQGNGLPRVVVTDLYLSDFVGLQLARYAKEQSSATYCILVTGQPVDMANSPFLDAMVMKPFELAHLHGEVQTGLEQAEENEVG